MVGIEKKPLELRVFDAVLHVARSPGGAHCSRAAFSVKGLGRSHSRRASSILTSPSRELTRLRATMGWVGRGVAFGSIAMLASCTLFTDFGDFHEVEPSSPEAAASDATGDVSADGEGRSTTEKASAFS